MVFSFFQGWAWSWACAAGPGCSNSYSTLRTVPAQNAVITVRTPAGCAGGVHSDV